MWGFGKSVGCAAFLVLDVWGNGNCRGVFFNGVCWRGQFIALLD